MFVLKYSDSLPVALDSEWGSPSRKACLFCGSPERKSISLKWVGFLCGIPKQGWERMSFRRGRSLSNPTRSSRSSPNQGSLNHQVESSIWCYWPLNPHWQINRPHWRMNRWYGLPPSALSVFKPSQAPPGYTHSFSNSLLVKLRKSWLYTHLHSFMELSSGDYSISLFSPVL